MKSKLLLSFSLFLVIQVINSQTRDPFLHPFAVESVWNLPLHRDAWLPENNVDANIDVVGIPQYLKGEKVRLFIEDPTDPLREFHRVKWSDRCTDHSHYENNYLHFPDDYVFNGEGTGQANAAWVMIKPDRTTIWDGTLFTRCTAGGWVGGAWFGPGRPYSLFGSGAGDPVTNMNDLSQVDIWGHGASRISAFGGLIRKGELTSPESEPIQHALKFTIRAQKYLCDCDLIPHDPFVWPAQGRDGYACDDNAKNVYRGTNPYFLMGSLLALPPNLTKEDLNLTTLVARKIFDALQTYGGYVVEDTGEADNWQFHFDDEALATDWPQGNHDRFNGNIYYSEITRILAKLHIITKNDPDNIGGGPTSDHVNRLAPVACPPGTFGSGTLCAHEYIADTAVAISGCPDKNIATGHQVNLNATVYPLNASQKGMQWTSSNTFVASVSMSGVVTAHAEGTATIIATTIDTENTAECTITVTKGTGGTTAKVFSPVADGSLNPGFTGTTIRVESNNTAHTGYLKFNFEGTGGYNISGCKLKLYCNGNNGSGTVGVYLGAHSDWDESNTTNLPDTSVLLGEVTTNFETGKWYEWDLSTFALYGDGQYTFLISQKNSGNDLWFDSREASNGPVLLLELVSSGPDVYPPAAPVNLFANVAGDSITLQWDSNIEGDIQGYNLYRSNTSGEAYIKLNTEILSETGYNDITVSRYTPYYYVVTAIDTSGNESDPSSEEMVVLAQTAIPSVLYSEDFNDGLAQGWIVNSGIWQILNNQYDQSATGSVVTSFYDSETFSDYKFAFNVYPIWKNYFGAVFNYQDMNNFYALEIHAGSTKAVKILKVEGGVSTSVAEGAYSDEVHQRWNDMEIHNRNGHTTIFINGNIVIDNVPTPAFANGKIGLYVRNSKVIYDNLTVSAFAVADTTNPTAPDNPVSENAGETGFSLSWTASTDEGGIAAYQVYINSILKATVSANSANVSGLPCDSLFEVFVIAVDSSGNMSDNSDTIFVSTDECSDITAPGAPDGLTATDITANSFSVSWNPSNDDIGVTGYKVYVNGILKGEYGTTQAVITGLECNAEYTLGVRATDAARNVSEPGIIQVETSACPDTQAPGIPTGFMLQDATQTTLNIVWNPSDDNVGTIGYVVFVNSLLVKEVSDASASLNDLECGTKYYVTVRAKDDCREYFPEQRYGSFCYDKLRSQWLRLTSIE
jgi:chitodextrinase